MLELSLERVVLLVFRIEQKRSGVEYLASSNHFNFTIVEQSVEQEDSPIKPMPQKDTEGSPLKTARKRGPGYNINHVKEIIGNLGLKQTKQHEFKRFPGKQTSNGNQTLHSGPRGLPLRSPSPANSGLSNACAKKGEQAMSEMLDALERISASDQERKGKVAGKPTHQQTLSKTSEVSGNQSCNFIDLGRLDISSQQLQDSFEDNPRRTDRPVLASRPVRGEVKPGETEGGRRVQKMKINQYYRYQRDRTVTGVKAYLGSSLYSDRERRLQAFDVRVFKRQNRSHANEAIRESSRSDSQSNKSGSIMEEEIAKRVKEIRRQFANSSESPFPLNGSRDSLNLVHSSSSIKDGVLPVGIQKGRTKFNRFWDSYYQRPRLREIREHRQADAAIAHKQVSAHSGLAGKPVQSVRESIGLGMPIQSLVMQQLLPSMRATGLGDSSGRRRLAAGVGGKMRHVACELQSPRKECWGTGTTGFQRVKNININIYPQQAICHDQRNLHSRYSLRFSSQVDD